VLLLCQKRPGFVKHLSDDLCAVVLSEIAAFDPAKSGLCPENDGGQLWGAVGIPARLRICWAGTSVLSAKTGGGNPNLNEAHHRVSPAGFKYLVTEQLCQATGGPQRYTGRSMYDSHAHLQITEEQWRAFLDDFQQTLTKFSVPKAEQAELLTIVQSVKEDIVLPGTQRAAQPVAMA
jgi:hemoglobin